MHSFYILEPRKVLVIECQDALNAIQAPRRDKTRIVDLHAETLCVTKILRHSS
jgi:hypothetical protein